jgi:uncharacterized protein YndB with AHSA1/START domain
MTTTTAPIHRTFTVGRHYAVAPARVFRAFTDPVKKRRWFAEGPGFVIEHYELDCRIGGFERCRFSPVGGPPMTLDSWYTDVVDGVRLVYAYHMNFNGAPMSTSLATLEFLAKDGGCTVQITEHVIFLDGNDGSAGRREGTEGLLDRLGGELDQHA